MFEIEENTLDELPYSITCLQFACLAYEAAPENVNSMQIPINKEIRHYQEEIFLGLNLRQMICSGAAIAVAVAVYLGLTPLLGHAPSGVQHGRYL